MNHPQPHITKMEVISNTGKFTVETSSDYDHAKELKKFVDTKAGVKGLVDSGIVKVPRIFLQPPENRPKLSSNSNGVSPQVPVIDLKGLENDHRRKEIVNEICEAAETWGFFQMVNHGVPLNVIDDALEGVRLFHEQPLEEKMEFYHLDSRRRVRYYSNGNLNMSLSANWRDSLACNYQDGQLEEEAMPQVCRKAISEYMKCMIQLKETLSELLSEALGLSSDYLASIECMKSESFVGNYYPACPEPDLALGIANHSDPFFLTILVQDNIGGLQILHKDQWVDVPFVSGSLVANLADLMKLITNDKFKSVVHRVLAQAGPARSRVSAACFFLPSTSKYVTPYGPVQELLSEKSPPIYQEVSLPKYLGYYQSKGLDGTSALSHFKL